MTTQSYGTVDASPTKEFFVDMLTRDVRLTMAILDLIDNCIDGALRTRGDESLEGLEVRIAFDKDQFTIRDNCGGIPLEIAKQYAFRFGRPSSAPNVKNSVGRFGVGMKRALFKLGRLFEVATRTEKVSYRITIDVEKWLGRKDWDFSIVSMERPSEPLTAMETGTDITVMELNRDTIRWFGQPYNETNLVNEISRRHQHHIDNGLAISLNGISIPPSQLEFLVAVRPVLRPAYRPYERNGVKVRLIAGVGKSDPQEAGWYVYCNGRMVLYADRTRTTGWGEPRMTPMFHNQYARFRGAAFFDSEDPRQLPWNTTKDGVDEGLPLYSEAYGNMVSMMQPVVRFLDAVDRDNENPEGQRPLVRLLERSANATTITRLSPSEQFEYRRPPPPPPPAERMMTIQYQKPKRLIDVVKKSLRVGSARAAGEATFDYYVDQEGIDAT